MKIDFSVDLFNVIIYFIEHKDIFIRILRSNVHLHILLVVTILAIYLYLKNIRLDFNKPNKTSKKGIKKITQDLKSKARSKESETIEKAKIRREGYENACDDICKEVNNDKNIRNFKNGIF